MFLCIDSDMSTGFRSESFHNYLSIGEIIHEKATVYTLQQNGRCERIMLSRYCLELIYFFFFGTKPSIAQLI